FVLEQGAGRLGDLLELGRDGRRFFLRHLRRKDVQDFVSPHVSSFWPSGLPSTRESRSWQIVKDVRPDCRAGDSTLNAREQGKFRPSPGLRPPSPRLRGARGNNVKSSASPRSRGEGARRADEGVSLAASEASRGDPMALAMGVPPLAPLGRDDTRVNAWLPGSGAAAARYRG